MVVKKNKLSLLRYVSIRDATYNSTIVSTAVSHTRTLLRDEVLHTTIVSTAVSYIERLLRDEVLRVLITERNFFPFTYLY